MKRLIAVAVLLSIFASIAFTWEVKNQVPPLFLSGTLIGKKNCPEAAELGWVFLVMRTDAGNHILIQTYPYILAYLEQNGGWKGHYATIEIYSWLILPEEWRDDLGFRRCAWEYRLEAE